MYAESNPNIIVINMPVMVGLKPAIDVEKINAEPKTATSICLIIRKTRIELMIDVINKTDEERMSVSVGPPDVKPNKIYTINIANPQSPNKK